jgi:hypothetical protein
VIKMNWLPDNASSVILILFIIYVFVRLEQLLRIRKEERGLTLNTSSNRESFEKGQEKHDEQIRLLGELLQNQREMLDVLKREMKDT